MLEQSIILAVALIITMVNAGVLVPTTITSQDSNIFRSHGNLAQVSTYAKSIHTPYSSVSKADVRVSNPSYTLASPIASYASSPYATGNVGPEVSSLGYNPYGVRPVARVAPAGLLGVAYSAAPAVSHMTYSNGLGVQYAW